MFLISFPEMLSAFPRWTGCVRNYGFFCDIGNKRKKYFSSRITLFWTIVPCTCSLLFISRQNEIIKEQYKQHIYWRYLVMLLCVYLLCEKIRPGSMYSKSKLLCSCACLSQYCLSVCWYTQSRWQRSLGIISHLDKYMGQKNTVLCVHLVMCKRGR